MWRKGVEQIRHVAQFFFYSLGISTSDQWTISQDEGEVIQAEIMYKTNETIRLLFLTALSGFYIFESLTIK